MTTLARPEPVAIGPTWQRDDEGLFIFPERTLGWHVLEWTEQYLKHPEGLEGEPWQFTPEQTRFVCWWYAVDANGRFVYRSGMFRRMKGHGKDPLAAALACVEFVGPCRFDHFGRDGQPVGKAHPAAWVQIAAVSRDQTRNAMTLFPGMFTARAIDEFSIDLGKEIIYAYHGRCRIEAVTSSPRALEGGRATFVVKDESHHWLRNNEGLAMADVIARNAAKSRDGAARVLAISNAHRPGEGSDAERDYEAYEKIQQGFSATADFLYDSIEAPEGTDFESYDSLKAGLLAARGDSTWLDVDRLIAEIQDPRTERSMARRFYLNQLVADEDRAFSREKWAAGTAPRSILPGELITLGFDGSLSRDHTALVATHVRSGYQWLAGYWIPEMQNDGLQRISKPAVHEVIAYLFKRYKVWRLNADPFKWGDELATWAGQYGADVIVSWNTTQYHKMAASLLNYRDAIAAVEFEHDDDPRFAACIGNAYRHEKEGMLDDDGEVMWYLDKERTDSPNKIDAAVAGDLSWEARRAAIEKGADKVTRARVYFV